MYVAMCFTGVNVEMSEDQVEVLGAGVVVGVGRVYVWGKVE